MNKDGLHCYGSIILRKHEQVNHSISRKKCPNCVHVSTPCPPSSVEPYKNPHARGEQKYMGVRGRFPFGLI